jgi:hypothetical protein
MSAVAINQSLLYCMRLLRSMRRRLVGKSLTCPVPEEKTLSFPFLSSQTSRQKFSPLHPMPSHAIPCHPMPSPPSPPHLILPSPLCVYSTITITIQFNSIQFIQSPSFILHKFAVKYQSLQFHSIACSGARWRCLSTPSITAAISCLALHLFGLFPALPLRPISFEHYSSYVCREDLHLFDICTCTSTSTSNANITIQPLTFSQVHA